MKTWAKRTAWGVWAISAFLGAVMLAVQGWDRARGIRYDEVVTQAVSPNRLLVANVTRKAGFGAITPDQIKVVINEYNQEVRFGSEVVSGSNLSGVALHWDSDDRLVISLPCKRFRSQSYYDRLGNLNDVRIIISNTKDCDGRVA